MLSRVHPTSWRTIKQPVTLTRLYAVVNISTTPWKNNMVEGAQRRGSHASTARIHIMTTEKVFPCAIVRIELVSLRVAGSARIRDAFETVRRHKDGFDLTDKFSRA